MNELKIKIGMVVAEWGALLKYFPQDAVSKAVIMRFLEQLIGHGDNAEARLEWLNSAMVNEVGEWQGAKECRGVFCTRFYSADGIEADCEHGPFSPSALEAKSNEIEARRREEIESGPEDPGSALMVAELARKRRMLQ